MSGRDERYETLTPTFKVRINGVDLPQAAVADIISLSVVDDVDAAGMCTLELMGWDGTAMKVKWMDDALFGVGNPIEIDMGYRDRTVALFSGEIVGLEPDFPQGEPPTFTVRAFDLRHRLMRQRRTQSYLNVKDSDIAVQLARRAGLSPDAGDTAVVLPYVLQHDQTDYQFLAARASLIGWDLRVDGRKLFFRSRPVEAAPELTLRRERELLSFRLRLSTLGQSTQREVRGWSVKDKRSVVAHASVGDEMSLMGGTASGGAAARHAFGEGGSTLVRRPVQSQQEADQLARQGFREQGMGYIEADGLCIGEPRLRAGIVVEIAGLGERFSGHYYVASAAHGVSRRRGYQTRFSARRNAT
jgi:phage protein D